MGVGTLPYLGVCDIFAKVRSIDKEETSSKVLCMGHDRPCFGVFLSRFVCFELNDEMRPACSFHTRALVTLRKKRGGLKILLAK